MIISKLIGSRLGQIWEESEKFAKIKTLTVSLEFLRGLQAMALIYFYISIILIILTASFFSALMYALTSFGHTGQVPVDVFVMVTGGLAVFSFIFLIWALREKRILKAFKIHRKIEDAITVHSSGGEHEHE